MWVLASSGQCTNKILVATTKGNVRLVREMIIVVLECGGLITAFKKFMNP